MSDSLLKFYIIKKPEETCEILAAEEVEQKKDPNIVEKWGPFNSFEEAISRRVGLIRSGKCKPH